MKFTNFSYLLFLLISSSAAMAQVQEKNGDCFVLVETMPCYSGCDSLSKKATYGCSKERLAQYLTPFIKKIARPNTQIVELLLQFIVETDGSISMVEVIEGNKKYEGTIKSAMTAGPKWIPGLSRNTPVKVQFRLPLKINLQ